MFAAIIFFPSSGVGGIVPNARISGPVKTFPHMTKSEKNAPTPPISPATIQLIRAPPESVHRGPPVSRLLLLPLPVLLRHSPHARLGHGPQVEHPVELFVTEQALVAHELPHGDVPRHRLLGEL